MYGGKCGTNRVCRNVNTMYDSPPPPESSIIDAAQILLIPRSASTRSHLVGQLPVSNSITLLGYRRHSLLSLTWIMIWRGMRAFQDLLHRLVGSSRSPSQRDVPTTRSRWCWRRNANGKGAGPAPRRAKVNPPCPLLRSTLTLISHHFLACTSDAIWM